MYLNIKNLRRKKYQARFSFEGWGENSHEGMKIVGLYKVCANTLDIMLHFIERQISTACGENMYA